MPWIRKTSVSASSVLNTIYQTKIDYDELKVLVLGLFSRKPNNLFEGNYAELRGDILERLYDESGGDEAVLSVLLLLLKESRVALKLCEDTYSGAEYRRYSGVFIPTISHDTASTSQLPPSARCCVTIYRNDLPTPKRNSNGRTSSSASSRLALENRPSEYHAAFLIAFQAVADMVLEVPVSKSESEIAQSMYAKISATAFSSLDKKPLLCDAAWTPDRQRSRASISSRLTRDLLRFAEDPASDPRCDIFSSAPSMIRRSRHRHPPVVYS